MSRVIPFRRSSLPSFLPTVLGAIAVAVIGFAATMTFLNWQSSPFDFTHLRKDAQSLATQFENVISPTVQYIGVDPTRVEILRPTPNQSGQRRTYNQSGQRPTPNPSGQRPTPNQSAERPISNQSGQIDVIDGDTVRFNGTTYRLAGIDTPERGNRARSDDERRRAEAATQRLRALVAGGDAQLTRVACACRPGLEGTRDCNYGRLCGSLSIGGRDAGNILISEGHARRYKCGATGCPQRRPW
jgi:endonuclease YncB( thermonuclease family)